MALLLNRAKMGTTTSGTGTVDLDGAAVSPFQTWAAAGAVNGGRYSYLLEDGTDWEIGEGIFTDAATDTLTRVLIASSTGSLLSLTGSATVACVAHKNEGFEAGGVVLPTAASMTWYNQDSSTLSDGQDNLDLRPQSNSEAHGVYISAPSTPYNVYARIRGNFFSSAADTTAVQFLYGIMLQDSSDGETLTFSQEYIRVVGDEQNKWQLKVDQWNSAGGYVSTDHSRVIAGPMPWFRVNNDGTTLTFYLSWDGRDWINITTQALATYIDTANRIGIYGYGVAANGSTIIHCNYFSTVAPY